MFGSPLCRTLTVLLCAVPLIHGSPNGDSDRAIIIQASEFAPRIGKRLERSRNVEVHLRTGEILAGTGVRVKSDSIELFSDRGKQRSIGTIEVRAVDWLQYTGRSRADSIRGGLLGGLGGCLLGGLLAFSLGSGGYDEAAVAVLAAAPAAGAYVGARLSGREGWKKVVIRD